jgi:hypothetical protein
MSLRVSSSGYIPFVWHAAAARLSVMVRARAHTECAFNNNNNNTTTTSSKQAIKQSIPRGYPYRRQNLFFQRELPEVSEPHRRQSINASVDQHESIIH